MNKGLAFQLFYSVKTNFCRPVLTAVKESGSGYEILSDMEWEKVKIFNPHEIVLNGPGKNYDLVRKILEKVDFLYFNIDNDTDFNTLAKINSKQINKIRIGLRVYLNTSEVWNRFGYNIMRNDLIDLIRKIKTTKTLFGFHFHFSTNNFKISNYQNLLSQIKNFCNRYKLELDFLDIGGGGLPAANEFIYEQEVYQKLPSLISAFFPKLIIISEAGRKALD